MFMTVVGYITIVILMCSVTVGVFLMALFNLGKYNIGGVPNSVTKKIITLIMIGGVITAWYYLGCELVRIIKTF